MAVDKKKLGALVDKHSQKKAPPKKPGGGGPPKKGHDDEDQHIAEEAEHEGDTVEHEQKEHDEGHDQEIAEQQAQRVANGNGDDELESLAGDIGQQDDDGEPVDKPEWATDEDVWNRAKKAVDALDDLDEGDHASVLVHTYDALGGAIDDGGGDDDEGDDTEDEGAE